jgi:hypothetical protein
MSGIRHLTLQRGHEEVEHRRGLENGQCDGKEATFVSEHEPDEQTMKDLCASFGISRETGHLRLRRYCSYRKSGGTSPAELNRAPPEALGSGAVRYQSRKDAMQVWSVEVF